MLNKHSYTIIFILGDERQPPTAINVQLSDWIQIYNIWSKQTGTTLTTTNQISGLWGQWLHPALTPMEGLPLRPISLPTSNPAPPEHITALQSLSPSSTLPLKISCITTTKRRKLASCWNSYRGRLAHNIFISSLAIFTLTISWLCWTAPLSNSKPKGSSWKDTKYQLMTLLTFSRSNS